MASVRFNYNPMRFHCDQCGKQRYTLDRFSVASDYRVLFEWDCECGAKISLLVTLESLISNMPTPPEPELKNTAFDLQFCKDAHITL